MGYDHQPRAGNRGDVWKHFILLSVLDQLRQRRPAAGFHYLETHAGAGQYPLRHNGGWQQGLGRFRTGPAGLQMTPYGSRIPGGDDSAYPGSWLLAARCLAPAGPFTMTLWERDAATASAAMERARRESLADIIDVRTGDGFTALSATLTPDLILVDPPYHPDPEADWLAVRQLAGELRRHRTPALIWYPDTPAARVDELLTATDARAAALCWEPAGSGFRGCGMAALGEAASIMAQMTPLLMSLAETLGGSLHHLPGHD